MDFPIPSTIIYQLLHWIFHGDFVFKNWGPRPREFLEEQLKRLQLLGEEAAEADAELRKKWWVP